MRLTLKIILLVIGALVAVPVVIGGLGIVTALAVVFLVLLAPVVVLGLVGWGGYTLLRTCTGQGWPKRDADLSVDDARLIQEVHQSLAGMERRIEALETILIERASPFGKV